MTPESLLRCKTKLKKWSKKSFGNSKKLINSKLHQVSNLPKSNKVDQVNNIKVLQTEVDKLLEDKDINWKQTAKQKH